MSRLSTVVALLCVAATRELAAQVPEVPEVQPDRPWAAVIIAVVLTLCAAAVSVMTPRRTHQD